MLKQKLQQKLLQKLSPQQIQMIKLLEIPTIQLEQRIKKEMEENPVLEEGHDDEQETDEEETLNEDNLDNEEDEFSLNDYMNDEDIPAYKLSSRNIPAEDKKPEIPFSVGSSFHDYLESQMGLRSLTEEQEILAQYILGNIDEDGYLRRKLENIVDDLAFSQSISTTEEQLHEMLRIIQDLDPAGVGARDLQECLLLQIERKDLENPVIKQARHLLKYFFQEFTKKHYEKKSKINT